MVRTKQIRFRVNQTEFELLRVLTAGVSREEWLRGVIRERASRRVEINELAIASFRETAREAQRRAEDAEHVGDDSAAAGERKQAAEYRDLIDKYLAETDLLRRRHVEA